MSIFWVPLRSKLAPYTLLTLVALEHNGCPKVILGYNHPSAILDMMQVFIIPDMRKHHGIPPQRSLVKKYCVHTGEHCKH